MLTYLMRVGDRVRMNLDAESAHWRSPPVHNGTEGTIVKIQRFTYYRGRFGIDLYSGSPGFWEKNGCPVVIWDDGTVTDNESWSLESADKAYDVRYQTEWVQPLRRGDDMTRIQSDLEQDYKIGELPELPYYERDLVNVRAFGEVRKARVGRVDYDSIGKFCNDGITPLPIYNVNFLTDGGEERGGSTSVRVNALRLLERGPVWNMCHGVTNTFNTIEEEVHFVTGLHQYTEVKNPAKKLYDWSKDEVLSAIAEGTVDGFSLSSGFFGSAPSISAVRFHDRDLGSRVRGATLAGFGRV